MYRFLRLQNKGPREIGRGLYGGVVPATTSSAAGAAWSPAVDFDRIERDLLTFEAQDSCGAGPF